MSTGAPITCIVVDDDDIDRLTTQSFLQAHPVLQCVGAYASAAALLKAGQSLPDVLFLDVDMPGMNGLDLRRKLIDVPACIFITAYPDYAVESFELDALDYMVKPLRHDRFASTVQRIESFIQVRRKAELYSHSLGGEIIFIKEGITQIKLQLHDILYLEALKDYTRIVTVYSKHMVLANIGSLLQQVAFKSFVRIHKSYAVQQHCISRYTATTVEIGGQALPLGRVYKLALQQIVSK
ncbi:MAG: LytTR family DNA-binding domain-containing protein [Bacteroidetes bacterium]|uniref:LytR/AlgR family response regulator transcription factor n=1 Tax=Phnomibacter sp. TaxID=2836217 RepID=UPI002FDE8FDC|nr:LytTR family DNA-binding domain-containing protein [Bacteroidota bacterium]